MPRSLLLAALALGSASASATTLFYDTFDYTVGVNLSGQSGGSGFAGAWSGGSSTIVNGAGGVGSVVRVGSSTASRTLASSISTASSNLYFAYQMSASNFYAGNYTGFSLYSGGTEQFFIGIPWDAHSFGFDATPQQGLNGVRTIGYTPATNTPFLIVVELAQSNVSGKVDVRLWGTSSLSTSVASLMAGSPDASFLGTRNNFSFDSIKLAGNYSGSLELAGVGLATTATEAVSASAGTPIPEPSTYGLALGGLALAAAALRRRKISK